MPEAPRIEAKSERFASIRHLFDGKIAMKRSIFYGFLGFRRPEDVQSYAPGLLNINHASVEELMGLAGIGRRDIASQVLGNVVFKEFLGSNRSKREVTSCI